jgi:exosortase
MDSPGEPTSTRLPVAWPIAVFMALGVIFFPTFWDLGKVWLGDSRYNHGYLVPAFSLLLLYWKRKELATCTAGSIWGLPLLLAGLGIRGLGTLIYLDWLDAIALLPCLLGVVVLWGGWRAFSLTWPAILFLAFMIPLPFQFETALSHPLQQLATAVSTRILRVLGYPAFSEGNVIRMGEHRIGVAEACSGLSMLVVFFALCTGVAMLIRRPLWERLLIVSTAVPIALIANIARIIVYTLLLQHGSGSLAKFFHDKLAAFLMMPLALILLWLAAFLFNWMFPVRLMEEDEPIAVAYTS